MIGTYLNPRLKLIAAQQVVVGALRSVGIIRLFEQCGGDSSFTLFPLVGVLAIYVAAETINEAVGCCPSLRAESADEEKAHVPAEAPPCAAKTDDGRNEASPLLSPAPAAAHSKA